VVFRSVAAELRQAGITVADSKVGEFVTSFDMAGASLTLLWLDDELEQLWEAPADTPAFRQGAGAPRDSRPGRAIEADFSAEAPPVPPATGASRGAASFLFEALGLVREALDREAGELGRIDAVAGDGDHGLGMQRGARAAEAAAEDARAHGAGVRTTLTRSAEAWSNRGGGASGALWGAALLAAAESLSDDASPTREDIAAAVAAAAQAVEASGKARIGDKTMVDALAPFAEAFGRAVDEGDSSAEAWKKACEAAARGAAATKSMAARIGRARPHAEKSIGTPDPGATSFVIVVRASLPMLTARELPHA
jgi:D-erythrulose 4-kinase